MYGFIWRNDPVKASLFFHGAKKKFVAARDQRQGGAQEISGVDSGNFLRLAAVDGVHDLSELGIAGTQPGESWIAGLDQSDQRRFGVLRHYFAGERGGIFGGIARFDKRVRGFLAAFRRIKLREARAQDAGLPIFAARGHLFLLDAIFHLPNFGAVIGGEAEDHQLEERVVRAEIEFVMKLRDERAEFFEEGDADGFEVGRFLTGILCIVLIVVLHDALIIAVKAHRSRS